jgi:transcriptional regulator with XRE-family HTH domain
MDIAEKLKTTRTSKNISVYKLSQMSGVSETHIRDLERGVRNPSFDTLNRLAEPMGISLSELFNDSDDLTFLNKEERELVDCFRLLPKDRADSLLNFIKTLV